MRRTEEERFDGGEFWKIKVGEVGDPPKFADRNTFAADSAVTSSSLHSRLELPLIRSHWNLSHTECRCLNIRRSPQSSLISQSYSIMGIEIPVVRHGKSHV